VTQTPSTPQQTSPSARTGRRRSRPHRPRRSDPDREDQDRSRIRPDLGDLDREDQDRDAAAALARERRLLERAVARGERRLGLDEVIAYRPVQVVLGALAALAVYFGGAKLDAIESSIDGLRKDAVTKVEFVQFQADQRAATGAAQTETRALERRVSDVEARVADDQRRAESQRAEWDRIVAEARERAREWEAREAADRARRGPR
jgi:hypothetical protein